MCKLKLFLVQRRYIQTNDRNTDGLTNLELLGRADKTIAETNYDNYGILIILLLSDGDTWLTVLQYCSMIIYIILRNMKCLYSINPNSLFTCE